MIKAETPPVRANPLPGNCFSGWACTAHVLPFLEQRTIYDQLS